MNKTKEKSEKNEKKWKIVKKVPNYNSCGTFFVWK